MPKRMSSSEKAASSGGLGRGAGLERAKKRANGALSRLEAHSADEDGAAFVAVLLETAADLVERQQVAPPLPGDERELWRSMGARFEAVDAVGNSRVRTLAAFGDLVARSFRGAAAIAQALGVDRSRISQRMGERSLYPFTGPDDERYFPGWQVHGGKTLPGLKTVLHALDPDAHPLSIDHWFRTPNVDLDIDAGPATPVEWLATGGNAEVAAELAADV